MFKNAGSKLHIGCVPDFTPSASRATLHCFRDEGAQQSKKVTNSDAFIADLILK